MSEIAKPGLYWLPEAKAVAKVVENRSKTRVYAKVLRQDPLTEKWSFMYAPGLINEISAVNKMTAEQASAFGGEHGKCCNCGQSLNDPRSTQAGYGPICAANNGWPWGQEEN